MVPYSIEIGIVDQYVFRVLLDNIITSNTFLSDCIPASNSATTAARSVNTDTFQKQQTFANQQSSGFLSARKYNLQLKGDFCAYVIRQVGVVL